MPIASFQNSTIGRVFNLFRGLENPRRARSRVSEMTVSLGALLLFLSASQLAAEVPPPDPLAVTEEMSEWVRQRVATRGVPEVRWNQLARALFALRFHQTPLETPTAIEAFHARQGSCVGFAHLVVSLAREVHLEASFLMIEVDPGRLRSGDLQVVQNHMVAGFVRGRETFILDASGLKRHRGKAGPLSDASARAIFLSNRGVQHLIEDAPREAARWLRAAVELDPELDWVWVNLGVAERRSGRPGAATEAYQRALQLSPGHWMAQRNLRILEQANVPPRASRQPTSPGRQFLSDKANSGGATRSGVGSTSETIAEGPSERARTSPSSP